MMDTFILIIELIGTVAFSISGAMLGIKKRMDIFGVIILGVVTSVGGGILRDLVIGAIPPACFKNSIYITVAIAVAVFYFIPGVRRVLNKIAAFDKLLFFADSIGLAIFTIVGVRAAMNVSQRFSWLLLITVGLFTGTFGGVLRDVLATMKPYVFVKHIYATTSIIGAFVYLVLLHFGMNDYAAIIISIAVIFTIRCLSAYFKWNLPRAVIVSPEEEDIATTTEKRS